MRTKHTPQEARDKQEAPPEHLQQEHRQGAPGRARNSRLLTKTHQTRPKHAKKVLTRHHSKTCHNNHTRGQKRTIQANVSRARKHRRRTRAVTLGSFGYPEARPGKGARERVPQTTRGSTRDSRPRSRRTSKGRTGVPRPECSVFVHRVRCRQIHIDKHMQDSQGPAVREGVSGGVSQARA